MPAPGVFATAETRRRGRSRRDQWGRRSRNASHSPAQQRRWRPPAAYPLSEEKQGKSPKVPGRADGTLGKGKGVVKAATAASALSSTQDNTVRVADVIEFGRSRTGKGSSGGRKKGVV